MGLITSFLARLRDTLLRPANIPAAIALLVLAAALVFFENQNQSVHTQTVRADVLSRVSLIRSRLEGNINANIQLVRGLVSVIATEPDIDQQRFSDLAADLFAGVNQMRSVAAAPDLVINMVYPIEGNEGALGLNYMENEAQREAALRARDTSALVIAGPVNLVQGGVGFVGRFPVFHTDEMGVRQFWGLVSTVVDAERLYSASGLLTIDDLEIAISGKDATGAGGPVFFGDPAVLEQDPVSAMVSLPSGSWQISAIPAGGWASIPSNTGSIRAIVLIAGLLVVVPIFILGQMFDERARNRREIEVMSRRLELALKASQIGVWENNVTAGELYWDHRMRRLYDTPATAPVDYKVWENRLHPDDRARAVCDFQNALRDETPYHSHFRLVLDDGSIRHIRTIGSVYVDRDGNKRIVGVNWDVTADVELNDELRRAKSLTEARNAELESAKADIEQMALHDALTGLPNRRALDDYLSSLASNVSDAYGILHIDLDRFKQINDTLGHAAGDATLVHTATILRKHVRENDFVARIGGDEFVVVCASECTSPGLERLADRIVAKMREPLIYQGRPCRTGVSIGVALSSSHSDDPRQMLINADIALYRAKNQGRNTHRFFSDELHTAAVRTKQLADEILTALDENQFITHYQGQFDAHTYQLAGVEALARWQHPERGLLAPSAFMEVAEDLNVLPAIDALVLDQSLRQMKSWRRSGVDVPRVAVNVSARRLKDPALIESLEKLEFEPGTLSFELVESTYLDQRDDQVGWNLDRIREMGISIEIDDFGTGYASIVSLMQLRPERLKIDRQLVYPATTSATQRELVRSIVEIGKSLDIEALAEGVETMEHAQIMRMLGCQTLQGFAFAKPMSGRAFANFARKHATKLQQGKHGNSAA